MRTSFSIRFSRPMATWVPWEGGTAGGKTDQERGPRLTSTPTTGWRVKRVDVFCSCPKHFVVRYPLRLGRGAGPGVAWVQAQPRPHASGPHLPTHKARHTPTHLLSDCSSRIDGQVGHHAPAQTGYVLEQGRGQAHMKRGQGQAQKVWGRAAVAVPPGAPREGRKDRTKQRRAASVQGRAAWEWSTADAWLAAAAAAAAAGVLKRSFHCFINGSASLVLELDQGILAVEQHNSLCVHRTCIHKGGDEKGQMGRGVCFWWGPFPGRGACSGSFPAHSSKVPRTEAECGSCVGAEQARGAGAGAPHTRQASLRRQCSSAA